MTFEAGSLLRESSGQTHDIETNPARGFCRIMESDVDIERFCQLPVLRGEGAVFHEGKKLFQAISGMPFRKLRDYAGRLFPFDSPDTHDTYGLQTVHPGMP